MISEKLANNGHSNNSDSLVNESGHNESIYFDVLDEEFNVGLTGDVELDTINYDYFKNSGMDKSMKNQILVESTGVINSVRVRSPSYLKNLRSNPTPQYELCPSQPCTAHSCVLLHHHLPAEVTDTAMQTDPILHLPPLFLHPSCAAQVVEVAVQNAKRFPFPIPQDVVKAAPAKEKSPLALVLPDVSEDADVRDKDDPATSVTVSKNIPPASVVKKVATVVEIAVQDDVDYDVAQYAVDYVAQDEDYAHVIGTEVVAQVDAEADVEYVTQIKDEAHVTEVVAPVADVANQDAVDCNTRVKDDAHVTENDAPVVYVVDDDELALVKVADHVVAEVVGQDAVECAAQAEDDAIFVDVADRDVTDVHKKGSAPHTPNNDKITLEDILKNASPVIKSTLRVYQTGASYLSNRTSIGKKSAKVSDLLESANFLKNLTGSTRFTKDKVGLVNYIVDRLDQVLKQQSDRCKHHISSSPLPQKTPVLKIPDSKHQYNKNRDAIPKAAHPAQDYPVRKSVKSIREIKDVHNKLEREKERKFVAKLLSNEETEVLTGLIESATSDHVKNILNLYSLSDKDKHNATAMRDYAFIKLPLETTYKHVLNKVPSQDRTKMNLSSEIVSRIKDMMPLHCQKCSDLYCVLEQTNTPVLKCFRCETQAHHQCMSDEIHRLDLDRGYAWLCYHCLQKPLLSKSKRFIFMEPHNKDRCNKLIGSLLSGLETHHAAKTLVRKFSIDLTDSFNAKNMEKNSDRALAERAYRTLMHLPETTEVKISVKDMIKQIIQYIKRDFPSVCGTCRWDYTVKEAGSRVYCHSCEKGGHEGCHGDDLADKDIGIVWICLYCKSEAIGNTGNIAPIEVLKKNPFYLDHDTKSTNNADCITEIKNITTIEEITRKQGELQSRKQLADKVPSSSPLSKYITEERARHPVMNSETSSQITQCPADRRTEVCPQLIEGICKYGWSGRGCEFLHPKRCLRYCSHGTSELSGCNKEACPDFHPKLCENSLKMRKCFNDDCKRRHLLGTARLCYKSNTPSMYTNPIIDASAYVSLDPSTSQSDDKLGPAVATPQLTFTPQYNRRHTKFKPNKDAQQTQFFDPVSFLVRRLESLKTNLMIVGKELGVLQDRLHPLQRTSRTQMNFHQSQETCSNQKRHIRRTPSRRTEETPNHHARS